MCSQNAPVGSPKLFLTAQGVNRGGTPQKSAAAPHFACGHDRLTRSMRSLTRCGHPPTTKPVRAVRWVCPEPRGRLRPLKTLEEELRDTVTLSGLAPRAQDPDEDEAYTPTQYEERSWDTFEQNPLRSMYGLADDNTNSSSNNNSTNGFIHQEKFVGRLPVQLNVPTCRYNSIGARTHQVNNIPCVTRSLRAAVFI